MWTRVVGSLVVLVLVTFVIQALLPRRARGRKIASAQYLRWDIAPLLGFFGLVLLVLSLVEAGRQEVIVAWGWGGGLGLVAGIGLWVALAYWRSQPSYAASSAKSPSTLRILWRIVSTYGIVLVVALLGMNLAIRWIGAALEVFLAGALAIFVIALSIALFTRAREQPSP